MEQVNDHWQTVEIDELGREYEIWLDWVNLQEDNSDESFCFEELDRQRTPGIGVRDYQFDA